MKRKISALFLAITMLMSVLPCVAMAEEIYSGACGDNLTWVLSDQGILTISGIGEMPDFEYTNPDNPYTDRMDLPWFDIRSDIREVVIEEGVTNISWGAFCNVRNLKKVTIADTVRNIGKSAFQQCVSLTEITLPEGVETIADGAFLMCSGLSDIKLPGILKEIGSGAFSGCESMTYFKLPKSLKQIGAHAFGNVGTCRIDFYGEAPEIDQTAFTGVTANVFYPTECESWKRKETRQNYGGELTWRNAIFSYVLQSGTCGDDLAWTLTNQGVLTISGIGEMPDFEYTNPGNPYTDKLVLPWFEYRSDICEVVIEAGVVNISWGAFCNTRNLGKVTIADTVKDIGKYAFQQCVSLKEIILPEGVEIIEDGAFLMCSGLSEVYLPSTIKCIGKDVFSGCESLTQIGAYESAVIVGDVNHDGEVGMVDVAMLYSYTKCELSVQVDMQCADTNGDKNIDIGDVALLYMWIKTNAMDTEPK